jgi:hypothetical protein
MPWEQLYTLTYNKGELRKNAQKAGDRLLSLFQYADGRMFFSSHTITNNDGFKYLFHEIEVPDIYQGTWFYGYFGYSRQAGKVSVYMKHRGNEFTQTIAAVHRLPKYLGLFVGIDGFHTPYNGKIAYLDLMVGDHAYRENQFDTTSSY